MKGKMLGIRPTEPKWDDVIFQFSCSEEVAMDDELRKRLRDLIDKVGQKRIEIANLSAQISDLAWSQGWICLEYELPRHCPPVLPAPSGKVN